MNTPLPRSAPSSRADREPRAAASSPARGDYSITFHATDEPFSALREAEAWLKARGFSYGPEQGRNPIGVLLGFCRIAKWLRLDSEERGDLHGMIACNAGNFRSGAVTVHIRRDAPHHVLEAFWQEVRSAEGATGKKGKEARSGATGRQKDEARSGATGKHQEARSAGGAPGTEQEPGSDPDPADLDARRAIEGADA